MSDKNEPDRILIERIKAGDKKAVKELYQKNWPMISKCILKMSKNKQDTEDIYQEGILFVYKQIINGKYSYQGNKISTYLHKVCMNKWLKWKQQQIPTATIVTDFEEEDDCMEATPLQNILDKALDQISEICQKLIINRHYHRKSHEKLALEFGYANPNVCKATLDRCMNKAREITAEILREYYNNEM